MRQLGPSGFRPPLLPTSTHLGHPLLHVEYKGTAAWERSPGIAIDHTTPTFRYVHLEGPDTSTRTSKGPGASTLNNSRPLPRQTNPLPCPPYQPPNMQHDYWYHLFWIKPLEKELQEVLLGIILKLEVSVTFSPGFEMGRSILEPPPFPVRKLVYTYTPQLPVWKLTWPPPPPSPGFSWIAMESSRPFM